MNVQLKKNAEPIFIEVNTTTAQNNKIWCIITVSHRASSRDGLSNKRSLNTGASID